MRRSTLSLVRLDHVIPDSPVAARDLEVTALAYDNRAVQPGTLFFCVPGSRATATNSRRRRSPTGAVALVVDRPLGLGVPEILVDNVRAAMAPAAAQLLRRPDEATLQTVGVTGTNGKTTTAFLVRDLLEAAGRQPGCSGPSSA